MAKAEFVIIEDMPGLQQFLKKLGLAIEAFSFKEHKDSQPQKRIKIYVGNVSQAFVVGWNFGMWYKEQLGNNSGHSLSGPQAKNTPPKFIEYKGETIVFTDGYYYYWGNSVSKLADIKKIVDKRLKERRH